MINSPTIQDYRDLPTHPARKAGGNRDKIQGTWVPEAPVVSIITIVRNRASELPRAIQSALDQSFPNIEYLIIDGASTDGTLDVIRQFDQNVSLWISEPDKGTSDAVNKGIAYATGSYICWLASDDWFEPNFVRCAVEALATSKADFVFGDLRIYQNTDYVRTIKGNSAYAKGLISGHPGGLTFPTLMIRRECFELVGLFNLTYKYSCDYEWILRLHLRGGKGFYDSRIVSNFRLGGIAVTNYPKGPLENLRILRQYDLPLFRPAVAFVIDWMRRRVGIFARRLMPPSVYNKLRRITSRTPYST